MIHRPHTSTPQHVPVLLAVLVLSGSCASSDPAQEAGSTVTVATTTAPAVASSTLQPPSPTTTTLPSEPVVRGPSAFVIGEEDCQLYAMEVPMKNDRDGEFICTVTSNDPRVAGTAHYTLNQQRWGTGPQNGSLVQWGTIRLENENGTWDADFTGVYTTETGDVVAALFMGTGDYEGLSYYRWSFETYGTSWPTKGLIFPTITDP
jgi:hypothetical protein